MRAGAAFLLIGVALAAVISNSLHTPTEHLRRRGEGVAKAMLVQHFRVVEYATRHPDFVGSVTPALLNLPTWHRSEGGISTTVDATGRVTTTVSIPKQGATEVARALQELSGFSEGTGLAHGGVVITPGRPPQLVPTAADLSPVITTRTR
ncbi:type IV pilus biogenesis protein PilM [Niveispirillum sp. SYP-B3756]|nr:type IV pilus biogenesis protein PilM [Niveispirillum sp. SYP-B3756]